MTHVGGLLRFFFFSGCFLLMQSSFHDLVSGCSPEFIQVLLPRTPEETGARGSAFLRPCLFTGVKFMSFDLASRTFFFNRVNNNTALG